MFVMPNARTQSVVVKNRSLGLLFISDTKVEKNPG